MSIKFTIVAPIRLAMMAASQQASLASMRIPNISCKIGCSNCCKRYICITIAEAIVLIDFLKKNGRWDRVKSAAESQQDTAINIRPVAWFKMGLACPILHDGVCDAYPVRPIVCSTHFVTSRPEMCGSTSTASGDYESCEMPDVHMNFARSFDRVLDNRSSLKIVAPMSIALLVADRISMDPDSDFNKTVSLLSKEFKF